MTPPRYDTIDPMVPELEVATYRTDGGHGVATDRSRERAADTEAPLVPDLS